MRLLCKKYLYADGTPQENKNFFSGVVPTLVETLDLNLYRERFSLTDVEYNFENRDNGDETLFTEASNFSFRCRNSVTNQTTNLQDFFEFFSLNNLSKWKLEWYNDTNELIYTGLIYKNNVKFPKRKDSLLNILVVGYEREFKEYFNNVPLGSSAAFPRTHGHGANPLPVDPVLQHFILYNAKTIFGHIFPNVQFEHTQHLIHWLNNFYISEVPYTYAPNNQFFNMNFLHIKTGYDSFYLDKVTKFGFFNGICQQMGWVWFFYLGKMYIKRRGDITLSEHIINHRTQATTHGIENSITEKQSDIIIIDNGSYFDNGNNGTGVLSGISIFRNSTLKSFNLGGDRSMFYSEKFPYYNYERPFRGIDFLPDEGDNGEYLNVYFNWSFTGGHEVNNIEQIFNKLTIGTSSPYSIDLTPTNYPIPKITRINPVINSRDNSGGFDKQNPRANSGAYYGNGNFYYAANQPVTSSHVFYNGGAGNCVIKYDSVSGKYLNYEAYCNTQEFRDNFHPLLKSEAQLVFPYEQKGLVTNPFITVKIDEYPFADINNIKFSVQTLAWSWENNKTKYILQNA